MLLSLYRTHRSRFSPLLLLQTYCFDGPADLVIEVTLPGAESADTLLKRRRYAAGGVPEYWIVAPTPRTWTLLRLAGDGYAPQPLDADGRYRSTSMPGLACDPARLWFSREQSAHRRTLDAGIFVVEPARIAMGARTKSNDDETWAWDWRPLTLPIHARPTPITFEQYLTWRPAAKFELMDGKPQIGGWERTGNVLGLLLMTFDLQELVTLLHPQTWVAALRAEEWEQQSDLGRRGDCPGTTMTSMPRSARLGRSHGSTCGGPRMRRHTSLRHSPMKRWMSRSDDIPARRDLRREY